MWESLLVVAGAFGATLLAIYINFFVLKPVFSDFKIEKTYDPKTGRWLYMMGVKNGGLRAARNCVGSMKIKSVKKEDVWNLSTNDFSTTYTRDKFANEPIDLEDNIVPWYLGLGEKGFNITINKGAIGKMSLLALGSEKIGDRRSRDFPFIYLEPSWESHWTIALGVKEQKVFDGEILITASNANPRIIRFSIETDDKNIVIVKIVDVEPKTKGKILRQILFGQ